MRFILQSYGGYTLTSLTLLKNVKTKNFFFKDLKRT